MTGPRDTGEPKYKYEPVEYPAAVAAQVQDCRSRGWIVSQCWKVWPQDKPSRVHFEFFIRVPKTRVMAAFVWSPDEPDAAYPDALRLRLSLVIEDVENLLRENRNAAAA